MPRLILDVVLQHLRQRRLCPVPLLKPLRQLIVPHEIMAATHLSCLDTRLDDRIAHAEVEDILLGLDVHPLLTIGRRHLAELGAVVGDGDIFGVVQNNVVDGGSEIEKANALCEDIEAGVLERHRSWFRLLIAVGRLLITVGRNGGDEGKEGKQDGELHDGENH